ncbi:MAG: MmcQ/YjbR family DNA-binding protein [Devosia sp.]
MNRLLRIVERLGLPEVTLSTSYGDPALKVRDKALVVVKEAGSVYLPCPLEMKEVLLEMAPEVYYQTDHYKGWPGLLVRLDAIDDEELGLRLQDAWLYRAPKRLAASWRKATPG